MVFSILSLFVVAAKRLWHHGLLMLCLLAGLVVAVGLLSAVPLYADAVHNRLLQGELTEAGTFRPPFSFLWRYIGVWHGEITWDEYAPVDQYLSQQAAGVIGLPEEALIRHVSTTKLRLFPAEAGAFAIDEPLIWAGIGFITELETNIQLLEGAFPESSFSGSDAIEVLVSQATADALGLQISEQYILFGAGADGAQIPVRISGVWAPIDPTSPFWFYQPSAFDELLLTDEENFRGQVVPALDTPVATSVWYQILDGSRVRPAAIPELLEGVSMVEARTTALLENVTLDASPVDSLQAYGTASRELSLVLIVFSLPLIGLILYFIVLIAGMVVRRGRSEIAIMRSRGTTRGQIVVVYFLEGLLIAMVGLASGLLFGRWLAELMGRTQTFLDPALLTGNGEPLVTVMSPNAIAYGLLGVGLALLALLLPALATSGHTIVTLRMTQSRDLVRPLWQRYYLDVLLLVPPLYGWYQLDKQGTVALLGAGDDPFANPLLFLVPILFCFALGLFLVRFFPLLMAILARLSGWLPFATPLLTTRQLARSATQYTGPLLLLCLTVSLATFAASMALTLDVHLHDQVYYQYGSDLNLAELGESTETEEQPGLLGQDQIQTTTVAAGKDEEPKWLFLPVSEHLRVPGVQAAARVGEYAATASIGGRQQSGRLLGIDRIDFAGVAFFRPDFALNEPLGGVLNRLAVDRANILVSRNFLARQGLAVGDPLRLTVGAAGELADINFTVAGQLDLFPTQYPQDGPFFVANLEYVHEQLGGTFPYSVWLATGAEADGQAIVEGVRDLGLVVVSAQDARATITVEQNRPERQGLFGLLSVGFLAAATLTVLGFLVYAIVSFRQRFIELGMLRAIGLSTGQMGFYLSGEQAALILSGVGLGTGLGVLGSILFIPYFQVGGDKTDLVPPFIVQIAWGQLGIIYAVFGIMFVIAVVVLIVLLIRMKVFEAVKLGEAV